MIIWDDYVRRFPWLSEMINWKIGVLFELSEMIIPTLADILLWLFGMINWVSIIISSFGRGPGFSSVRPWPRLGRPRRGSGSKILAGVRPWTGLELKILFGFKRRPGVGMIFLPGSNLCRGQNQKILAGSSPGRGGCRGQKFCSGSNPGRG